MNAPEVRVDPGDDRPARHTLESAKPLALLYTVESAMKATTPLLPTEDGFYTDSDSDAMIPKIGTAH
ncbi:MAG: hypothetical protein U1F98_12315 [Verrucomicrobiota bacterium]